MSKFNRTKKVVTPTPNTRNAAGGVAYKMSDKKAFVEALLTSFVSATFYKDEQTLVKEIEGLVSKINDPLFAAKAAVFARNEYGMRSVTHLVAGQLAAKSATSGQSWAQNFFDSIVFRPDDMTEILAAYFAAGGKKVPNALKKGFANAFSRFDGDTLSKYVGNNKEIKLVDIVNLVHPKPTTRNKKALKALVEGSLKNTTTSSRALTAIGQSDATAEEKQEMRTEYYVTGLKNGTIKYIDAIRNLTRINEAGEEAIKLACALITDREKVRRNKVMPYTIYLAYRMCKNAGVSNKIQNALQEAIEFSLDNIPNFDGNTAVVVDCSGSMTSPVNSNNKTATYRPSCNEVANLFAAMLAKRASSSKSSDNVDVYTFDMSCKPQSLNTRDSVVSIAERMENRAGGTSFPCIFPAFSKKYDRVIILSDMQGWCGVMESTIKSYNAKFKASPRIYMWNLAQNGTIQAPEKMVRLMAGFSEKCFEAIEMLESDPDALLKKIEEVSFSTNS